MKKEVRASFFFVLYQELFFIRRIHRMKEKVPKSLAKAATANMKMIKRYKPTRKERIDHILENRRKNDPKVDMPEEDKKAYALANVAVRQNDNYCSVESFERSVFLLEGIHIVLRAPTYATVRRYPFKKRCSKDTTVHDFVEKRIKRVIDSTYQVYVVSEKPNPLSLTVKEIRKYHTPNS